MIYTKIKLCLPDIELEKLLCKRAKEGGEIRTDLYQNEM